MCWQTHALTESEIQGIKNLEKKPFNMGTEFEVSADECMLSVQSATSWSFFIWSPRTRLDWTVFGLQGYESLQVPTAVETSRHSKHLWPTLRAVLADPALAPSGALPCRPARMHVAWQRLQKKVDIDSWEQKRLPRPGESTKDL